MALLYVQVWLQDNKTTRPPVSKIRLEARIVCSSISFSVRKLYSKLRLEAYTERSESNPGLSLGTINARRKAVWKTVPKQTSNINKKNYHYLFFLYFYPLMFYTIVQNLSRITPMRRILSFHGFYLLLDVLRISLRLTALDCFKRRDNPKIQCALAHKNPLWQIKIRERTDPSHLCYPWLSLNACARREAMSTL